MSGHNDKHRPDKRNKGLLSYIFGDKSNPDGGPDNNKGGFKWRYVVLAGLIGLGYTWYTSPDADIEDSEAYSAFSDDGRVSYEVFKKQLEQGSIDSVVLPTANSGADVIQFTDSFDALRQQETILSKVGITESTGAMEHNPHRNVLETAIVGESIEDAQNRVLESGVSYTTYDGQPSFVQKYQSGLAMLFLGAVTFWMFKKLGVGKNLMANKGAAKLMRVDKDITTTFDDVIGLDNAKKRVGRLIDYLRDPDRFRSRGARLDKGYLFVGPPGTGKTLLARAIAGEVRRLTRESGEVNIPVFSISGSDFVEMFVGVGASRVRDMFAQARAHKRAIIFIDEIEGMLKTRGGGGPSGNNHDEQEQTLRQFLAEMDGIQEHDSEIIVIGATNHPEGIDPAALRRFTQQVQVQLPDVPDRKKLFQFEIERAAKLASQTRGTTVLPNQLFASDIDLDALARLTTGFSPADIAKLVNEAVLTALEDPVVTQSHFEKAHSAILAGDERPHDVMTPEEKLMTARHEAGHALMAALFQKLTGEIPESVSIVPQDKSLGLTFIIPERDRTSADRNFIFGKVATLFAGRIEEEMLAGGSFGVSMGAANDIERATHMLDMMVHKGGLTRQLPLKYAPVEEGSPFAKAWHSAKVEGELTDEILTVGTRVYEVAAALSIKYVDKVNRLSEELMKHERLSKEQIDAALDLKEEDFITKADMKKWFNDLVPPTVEISDELMAAVCNRTEFFAPAAC